MSRVKRAALRRYVDDARVLLGSDIASRKGIFLRLAESLAKEGIAIRPLDLYATIVNDRFTETCLLPGDAAASVVTIVTPAVNRATVSLAVTARALRIGDERKVRILVLIVAPDRHADLSRDLLDEAVALFADPEKRMELLRAPEVARVWSILRGGTDA